MAGYEYDLYLPSCNLTKKTMKDIFKHKSVKTEKTILDVWCQQNLERRGKCRTIHPGIESRLQGRDKHR
jgi:hypothetical protein